MSNRESLKKFLQLYHYIKAVGSEPRCFDHNSGVWLEQIRSRVNTHTHLFLYCSFKNTHRINEYRFLLCHTVLGGMILGTLKNVEYGLTFLQPGSSRNWLFFFFSSFSRIARKRNTNSIHKSQIQEWTLNPGSAYCSNVTTSSWFHITESIHHQCHF